jgi:hypothetical protein
LLLFLLFLWMLLLLLLLLLLFLLLSLLSLLPLLPLLLLLLLLLFLLLLPLAHQRRLRDKTLRLDADPPVNVLVVAARVGNDHVLHLADLVEQLVVLALQLRVLRLELALGLLQLVHPGLLLAAALGRRDAVALQELVALGAGAGGP